MIVKVLGSKAVKGQNRPQTLKPVDFVVFLWLSVRKVNV